MTNTTASAPTIAEMLKGFSIELNPGDAKVMDAAPGRLDPGTEVFLTWIPGTNPMETVAPAAKLRKAGLFPTPHIGARHIESAAQLEQFAATACGRGRSRSRPYYWR